MSHNCLLNYQNIIPIYISNDIVEYIEYDTTNTNKNQCNCIINKDHIKHQYILHQKTDYPSVIKFLSLYFNWFYKGNYNVMKYDDWIKSVYKISRQCDCCKDNIFFD
jgi:hypothetical protein